MSRIKRLFGRVSDEGKKTVGGGQIGRHVKRLAAKGAAEGWDPVESIHISCTACSAPVRLRVGPFFLGANLCFHTSDGGFKNLGDPLSCEECGADTFEVQVSPKDQKDVFREAVDSRPPCDEDPARGFRCAETGDLIPDPSFLPARDFEELWSRVSRWVDLRSGLNDDFEFDYFVDKNGRTRYIENVAGVLHCNRGHYVCVIRDKTGRYWYCLEPR